MSEPSGPECDCMGVGVGDAEGEGCGDGMGTSPEPGAGGGTEIDELDLFARVAGMLVANMLPEFAIGIGMGFVGFERVAEWFPMGTAPGPIATPSNEASLSISLALALSAIHSLAQTHTQTDTHTVATHEQHSCVT